MLYYCDTHVHCYDFGDLPRLLGSALVNMQAADSTNPGRYVLFFTNSQRDTCWGNIKELASNSKSVSDWQFDNMDESLIFAKKHGQELILAPARQLVSKENLEILLLGCDENLADGDTAEQIIGKYQQSCCVILPWGVGKWLGARGKVLTNLINDHGSQFHLGDNGGRPSVWNAITHFKQARHADMSILNGSDPLPIANDVERVGKFGISFKLADKALSLQAIIDSLKDKEIVKHNYGSPISTMAFIKSQISLRYS